MVENALSAAQQVLADQVHFELSSERWEAFCAALECAPRKFRQLRTLLTKEGIFDGD